MGHRGNFVIIEDGKVAAYHDQWAGLGSPAALLEGPEGCLAGVKNFTRVEELLAWEWCEGGWLVDLDARTVIVFGECSLEVFEEAGEDMESPDLLALRHLSDGDPVAYFRAIAARWPNWTLRWDQGGTDAFSSYLRERKLSSGLRLPNPSERKHPVPFEFLAK
jgi:hypothetical protein